MRNTKKCLLWITTILKELNIPFQISGGLAARAYGSTRELADIDIDIPENYFEILKDHVNQYIIFGPDNFKDENWGLLLMTLNYEEQEIDLGGAYQTKVRRSLNSKWHPIAVDFSKSIILDVLGLKLPVIPKHDLLAYKKILSRPVDIADINELSGTESTIILPMSEK